MPPPAAPPPEDDATRRRALSALTLVAIAVCGYVALPLVPAIAWAVALAVMALPLHRRLADRLPDAWAAGLSTAVVVVCVVAPVALVAGQLGAEASRTAQFVRDGQAEAMLDKVPYGKQAAEWVRANVDLQAEGRKLAERLSGSAAALAQGSAWAVFQGLVCLFILFFALRDWRHLLAATADLLPLTQSESDHLFDRVSDSIHATVYATVVTGVVQGAAGGLLFWLLGLPGPVLWGVAMAILGIIPLAGAFLVWAPAAAVLAADGRWGAAAVLVGWGVLMAGPVNNWLYARVAGDRAKLHPAPVLIAFVGGLAAFGASGMVIGPAALAVTLGLLEVWRRRLGSGPPSLQLAGRDANG